MVTEPLSARSWKPSSSLAPYVEQFAYRDEGPRNSEAHIPLPARSDCFLQFYFSDRYRIRNVASGKIHTAPPAVLVGPHTARREDLLSNGHLKLFTIRFTPTGFRGLFATPARLIRDYANDAESVLGPTLHELEDRLVAATVDQLPLVAEAFLLRQLSQRPIHPRGSLAAHVAHTLKASHGQMPVARVAETTGVSLRQMERIFLEHVGLTPKVFGRLERLKRALALGDRTSSPNWVSIAVQSGYFDQAHMIREFQEMNGTTPPGFFALKKPGLSGQIVTMSQLSNLSA